MFRKHGVPPENTLSVGTAALRSVEKAIAEIAKTGDARAAGKAEAVVQRLRDAFKPYTFEIISEEKEAALVAEAATNDLYKHPTPEMRALTKKYDTITVAHCGGRSTEIIRLAGGHIEKKDVLRYGVHTHKGAGPCAAREALESQLQEKWAEGEGALLAVGGGVWRAVGKLVCAEGAFSLPRREAEEKLMFLEKQDTAYFEKRGDKKRAPHMAAAAQSLLQLIRHTDAETVAFLTGKIVSVLTTSLREKKLNPSSCESQRLSCPSAP
jgi:exopolyphosphatase/pppGpp-phosphohydrolase